MKDLFGAVEAGGTKFICAVGTSSGALIDETRIPTGAPAETMDGVPSFFRGYRGDLAAIGIGSFGPIGLQRGSPAYIVPPGLGSRAGAFGALALAAEVAGLG